MADTETDAHTHAQYADHVSISITFFSNKPGRPEDGPISAEMGLWCPHGLAYQTDGVRRVQRFVTQEYS